MKKIINTLGIDRWSKYIGLATMWENTNIAMPIGYLLNDQMIYFNISDIITRNYVKKIVIWYPSKQKDIQEKINKFMQSLEYIIDKSEISIEKIDEDYSSVQSGEIVSNFKKNVAEDTVSAMIILERRSEKRNS